MSGGFEDAIIFPLQVIFEFRGTAYIFGYGSHRDVFSVC